MLRLRAILAISVLVLVGPAGCTLNSAVKRTALIPAPKLPARVGRPLQAGKFRMGGDMQVAAITRGWPVTPRLGDPGVLIPNLVLGGSAYVGLTDSIEIGARVNYSDTRLASANTHGVIDFPGNGASTFGAGAGTRINVPVARVGQAALTLALLGELDLTTVPEASFRRTTPIRGDADYDYYEDAQYELVDIHREAVVVPNAAVALGVQGGIGYGSVLLGVTTSIRNIGFDSLDNLTERELNGFAVGYLGVGGEVVFGRVYVGGHAYLPFEGQDLLNFGLRLQVHAGVEL